jgi:decaprenyl-phosphate phosphoribosyltransferase
MKTTALGYLRLLRFPYHVTFFSVAAGALLSAQAVTAPLAARLVLLYVSFNVLLYGGIYTLNAIADAEADGRHPFKSRRPLPAGDVGQRSACVFALALILGGLASGLLLKRAAFPVYLAFLALNILYTFSAKHVAYVELAVNSATHPLRLLLGMIFVDGEPAYGFLAAFFCFAFGLAVVRREVEKEVKGWEVRKALGQYSEKKLFYLRLAGLMAMLLVSLFDRITPAACRLSLLAAYALLVFGVDHSAFIKGYFIKVWTR